MTPATHLGAGTNWSGNVVYGPAAFVEPTSAEELASILHGARAVKALGTRHSFNRIADTDGVLISTRSLPQPVEIDTDRKVVRTGGGIRYGDLAGRLHERGWALPNLASLPHISVAGAIASGTHGSGDGNHSLAAAVAGLELITADGQSLCVRRGDPDFDGMVVSLGAIGILTAVELDILPTFELTQTVYERLPLGGVLADVDSITSCGYSTSMFTTWRDPAIIDQLWVKRRMDASGSPPSEILGAPPATGKRHPLPGVDPEFCTDQLGQPGPWVARLPHFKLEFTPSNGDELQSEYLVPRPNAVSAISAVRDLAPHFRPILQVCELRTVASDTLWLSGAYETDVLGIHFTWRQDGRAVAEFLPVLESALAPFAARPHWGKLFDLAAAGSRLPSLYPRWDEFRALRKRLDPSGKFLNDFLRQLDV